MMLSSPPIMESKIVVPCHFAKIAVGLFVEIFLYEKVYCALRNVLTIIGVIETLPTWICDDHRVVIGVEVH